MIYSLPYFDLCCLTFNDLFLMTFADRRVTEPNFSLVNKEGLDKILKVEVFVNEDDGQLREAHLIPGAWGGGGGTCPPEISNVPPPPPTHTHTHTKDKK